MELLPSFADIQLEPATSRLQEELEVIPTPAALSQRVLAGAMDVMLVLIAGGLFTVTFLKLAEETGFGIQTQFYDSRLYFADSLWTVRKRESYPRG